MEAGGVDAVIAQGGRRAGTAALSRRPTARARWAPSPWCRRWRMPLACP